MPINLDIYIFFATSGRRAGRVLDVRSAGHRKVQGLFRRGNAVAAERFGDFAPISAPQRAGHGDYIRAQRLRVEHVGAAVVPAGA